MEARSNPTIPIGIYGWRKRCLYLLVLLLIVIIILNIGLTIWILAVLKFNIHGMGGVRIMDDGVQIQDTVEFVDTLYTQSITTDEELQLQSHQDIIIETEDSQLLMTSSAIDMRSHKFSVELNSEEEDFVLLSTSPQGQLNLASSSLYFSGSQGMFVEGNLTVQEIVGLDERGLILESLKGNLVLSAENSLQLESNAGPVDIFAGGNITLSSTNGLISISASSIVLESLPTSVAVGAGMPLDDVYNLCVCPSGKLYRVLATPENTQGCLINEGTCT